MAVAQDIKLRLMTELTPGEKVYWAVHPEPSLLIEARRKEFKMTVIGLLFPALIIWPIFLLITVPPILYAIVILPQVLIIILVYIFQLMEAKNVHRVIYAVTSKRLIIIGRFWLNNKVESFGKKQIAELTLRLRNDTQDGDLIFANQFGTAYNGKTTYAYSVPIGFIGVKQANKVRQLVIRVFELEEADYW